MKPVLHIILITTLAALGFIGCRSSNELIADKSANSTLAADQSEVNYSVIYLIHGDANYLYHENGRPLQADEEKVKEAISVAEQAEKGEVFIFYQRPESKVLGIFPYKDRLLLHYRNGELMQRQRYSPASSDSSFVTERQLFDRYHTRQSKRKILLYFGHEIPYLHQTTYHRSRPDANFNIDLFASGAESFLDPNQKFDLTVLSTCNNGTPAVVSEMQSISNYLLASPQNLHLSHIDTEPLLELETDPQQTALSLAEVMADKTYNRLQNFLETAITLSVYNLEAGDSLDLLSKKYAQYRDQQPKNSVGQENTDCATLSFWDGAEPMEVFYKPAQFGAHSNRESHSGWGCRE